MLSRTEYLLPNDEAEQDRLGMPASQETIHSLNRGRPPTSAFLLSLGDLHLAPISETPHNVLDIGTGTGIWAIDFGMPVIQSSGAILTLTAEKYPSANVVGTDLSPIQPE